MKNIFALILLLMFAYSGRAQNYDCPVDAMFCNGGKTLKKFEFSNRLTLSLAGFAPTVKKGDTLYSGIDLFQCGQNEVIEEWGEIESCKVERVADTILVTELYGLPVGKGFEEIWQPFYTDKFFFKGGILQHISFYRKDIKKYSGSQIIQVLQDYKKLSKGNYDHTITIANRLFWAYVSGSKQAEVYLKELPEKFGPFDGAIAEEWKDIKATYQNWKTLSGK